MVPEPAVRPPWADPEALVELLDELRAADYKIGLEEYAAAQDLLFAFAAAGVPLDEADRFRDHLGPLVCSSPQEQEEFRARFAGWLVRRSDASSRAVEPVGRIDRITHEARKIERGQRLWTWAITGAALVAAAAFLWIGSWLLPALSQGQVPDEPAQTSGFPALFVGTALALLLLAASGVWWRWRARLFLVRRSSEGPVELTLISVATPAAVLFPPPLLARLARDLRRRLAGPSMELDVPATLIATLRGGGWLTPVYGTRQLVPEYLVLIDRAGYGDQQARLAEELMDRLGRQGVLLTRYSFRSDPRICFPLDRAGAPVTLRELACRFSSHHLLLVTDGSPLFSSRTGELADWSDQLLQWEHRTVLTPEAPERWSSRETALARRFHVLPATVEGWSRFARQARSSSAARSFVPSALPYPEPLRLHPQRFLDRHPPEAEVTEEMLAALRRFLGEAGFFWLSACAVYPVLDWRLTLYLGEVLAAPDGGQLLHPDRLIALVRTPWLRQGFMPDWLRLRLITGLSTAEERQVREALGMMLATALNGPVDGLALEVARPHRTALAALAGRLLRSRKGLQEGLPEDRVFRTFMDNRLAVRLPRTVLGMLRWRPAPQRLRPGNPWENRHKIGGVRAFFATIRIFLVAPRRAYDMTAEQENSDGAFRFATLVGALTGLPIAMQSLPLGCFSSLLSSAFLFGFLGILIIPWAAFLHLSLKLTGGLARSRAGVKGTFRVTCYATVASVWNFIPAVGFVPAFLGTMLLTFYGLASLHRASKGRVLAAMVLAFFILLVALGIGLLLIGVFVDVPTEGG